MKRITVEHIALALFVIIAVVLFINGSMAQGRTDPDIIVVRTGETRILHYNPDTSEEVRHEMADGNIMLMVKPKN